MKKVRKEEIKKLKKEIERQIYFSQSLTNNYSTVIRLRSELRILEEEEKNQRETKEVRNNERI